jgi:hypothetical protein
MKYMTMENLPNPSYESRVYKIRSELQIQIARLDTSATPDMDSTEERELIEPWIIAHSISFSEAWEAVAESHSNIVEDYSQHPDEVIEQIRDKMERIEKDRTVH